MPKSTERILQDDEHLYGRNGNYRSYCQDLASFFLPRKAWITSIRMYGERIKDTFLYDVAALRCLKESALGFHSHLTNPSIRYFQTSYVDDRAMQFGRVQRYLHECDEIQFDVMNASNWENAMIENYIDGLLFGNSNLQTLEDEVDHVRYTELPVEQYNFTCDARNRVDEIYWSKTYTALQCASIKDWQLPKEVHDALVDQPYKTFDVLHYIGPRDDRDPYKADQMNKPWRYVVIMKKPEHKLFEGGFEECPNAVDRFWTDPNDPNGFSPAMDILASVKLKNAEKRTAIRSGMKKSDGAWLVPYRGFLNTPNMNPNAFNYYDAKKFKPDAFQQIQSNGDFSVNMDMMNLETQEIERALFVDIFRAMSNVTLDKKKRSVMEVQRIIAEGMTMIGPVVSKKIKGTITPALSRTHNILKRRMLFPPEPDELKGKKKTIDYLSPLAKAQRQSQQNGIMTVLQLMQELSQFKPEALDKLDVDRCTDIVADIQGVDPSIYLSKDKVVKIRQQRAKMQQQQQKIAMAEQAGKAAQHGARAHRDIKEAAEVGAE